MLDRVYVGRLAIAALLLPAVTGCGSHAVADRSKASLAAMTACQSRFDLRFHLRPAPRSVSDGFVSDLGGGRLRVRGTVPVQSGLPHRETYTCVVRPGTSGPHVVSFRVAPAT